MRTDFNSNMDYQQSLAPALLNVTTNGSVIDVANYGEVEIIIVAGVRTDGTHTPKVQEGSAANGSDAADVAAADLVGTALVAITSNVTQRIGYIGSKRYIRVVSTVVAGATGATYGAYVCRGGARKQALP